MLVDYRHLVLISTITHCAVILGCIASVRVYRFKNQGNPKFIEWWAVSLSVVFLLYLMHLAFVDHEGSSWRLAVEGLLSNLANVFLLRMASAIRGQDRFPVRLWVLSALLLLPPTMAFLLASSESWFGVALEEQTHGFLIRVPSALFSFIALVEVGQALYENMVAPRRFARIVFRAYGSFQLGYALIPVAQSFAVGDYALLLEESYRGVGFVFKVASTVVVLFAASELAKREEFRAIAVRVEEKPIWKPKMYSSWIFSEHPEPSQYSALLLCDEGHKGDFEKAIASYGARVLVLDDEADIGSVLKSLSTCQFAVLATRRRTAWQDSIALNLASQRKEWLQVSVRGEEPTRWCVSEYEPLDTKEYCVESPKDLSVLIGGWMRRRGFVGRPRRHQKRFASQGVR